MPLAADISTRTHFRAHDEVRLTQQIDVAACGWLFREPSPRIMR